MTQTTDENDVDCVIVCANKKGHLNQCLALCDRLEWRVSNTINIVDGSYSDPFAAKLIKYAKRFRDTLKAWPWQKHAEKLVIVASGVSSEPIVAAYRKLYGEKLFAVFIGLPKSTKPIFDVVVASNHAINPKFLRLQIPGVLVRETPPPPQFARGWCFWLAAPTRHSPLTFAASPIRFAQNV